MKINEKIRSQFTPSVYQKACLIYIESNQKLIAELRTSDALKKSKLLHKLKGGTEMLGFIDMGQLLFTAEQNIEEDFSEEIELLFNEIKLHFK